MCLPIAWVILSDGGRVRALVDQTKETETPNGGTAIMENCGQPDHGLACNCDVKLSCQPVPVRYGLDEVWHAREVMRSVGLLGITTPRDVATWAENVLDAYDSWRAIDDAPSLREATINLIRSGTSMADVPRLLGVELPDVVASVLKDRGSPAVGWDEVRWLEAEGVLYDEARTMSARAIGRRLGVNHKLAGTLCELYGVEPNADANDRLASMREHTLAGLHPHDVVTAVRADGYDVNYNQCIQLRYKLVERGEVDREMPPRRHLDAVRS